MSIAEIRCNSQLGVQDGSRSAMHYFRALKSKACERWALHMSGLCRQQETLHGHSTLRDVIDIERAF